MKSILAVCVMVLCGGCGARQEPGAQAKGQPESGIPNPVIEPIRIGEQIQTDLRRQNEAARVRRAQMDEVIDRK